MSQRTHLIIVIAAAILAAGALAVALTQCGARPAPATAAPTDAATEEPGTPTTTPGLTPTPTLTAEELLARELIEPRGQVTFSADECSQILETESWCSVIKSAKPITRPEWEELFPQTDFFSVRVDVYGGESRRYRNWLIVEQDGQCYTSDTFDRLLAANGITEITDEDRELVAKAFVLMTLPDHIEEEIRFSGWETGSWPSPIRLNYNYTLTAWTKIQGLKVQYWFLFYDDSLMGAEGYVSEYGVGDHIDVPFETLPPPGLESLSYWRR